jgi:hypothetical protein
MKRSQRILMFPLERYYLLLFAHKKKPHKNMHCNAKTARMCVCVCFMYLVVFGERLQHFLKLYLQLVKVALTELGPAHLLGGGEGVERLGEEEVVLLIQGVLADVRDVSTAHLVRRRHRAQIGVTRLTRTQSSPFSRMQSYPIKSRTISCMNQSEDNTEDVYKISNWTYMNSAPFFWTGSKIRDVILEADL